MRAVLKAGKNLPVSKTWKVWLLQSDGNLPRGPLRYSFSTPSEAPNPTVGDEVIFDAASSTDPDGSIESYSWDFGDGETATGVSTTHTYNSSDTYSVHLTVRDDDGEAASTTKMVTVSTPETNNAPQVSISSTKTSLPDQTPHWDLDGTGSSDPDGDALTYQWEVTDTNVNVYRSFDNPQSDFTGFDAEWTREDKQAWWEITLSVSDGQATSTDTVTLYHTCDENYQSGEQCVSAN